MGAVTEETRVGHESWTEKSKRLNFPSSSGGRGSAIAYSLFSYLYGRPYLFSSRRKKKKKKLHNQYEHEFCQAKPTWRGQYDLLMHLPNLSSPMSTSSVFSIPWVIQLPLRPLTIHSQGSLRGTLPKFLNTPTSRNGLYVPWHLQF